MTEALVAFPTGELILPPLGGSLRRQFCLAADRASGRAGGEDRRLRMGGLAYPASIAALRGRSGCCTKHPHPFWTPKSASNLFDNWDHAGEHWLVEPSEGWILEPEPEPARTGPARTLAMEAIAYWSALEFLRVVARNGLAVRFEKPEKK